MISWGLLIPRVGTTPDTRVQLACPCKMGEIGLWVQISLAPRSQRHWWPVLIQPLRVPSSSAAILASWYPGFLMLSVADLM